MQIVRNGQLFLCAFSLYLTEDVCIMPNKKKKKIKIIATSTDILRIAKECKTNREWRILKHYRCLQCCYL